MRKTYTIQYRLDDITDYDKTEYFDGLPTKKEAMKIIKNLKQEYKNRLVMIDLCIYDSQGYLIDAETIL